MSSSFQPGGLIIVRGEITRPSATLAVRLLLDTGATTTVLRPMILASAGIDVDDPLTTHAVQVSTAGGTVPARAVMLTRFSALGKYRFGLRITAHDLPASLPADGILGLDFLDGHVLTIDFKAGTVDLA
jgi:predicted aspartyl protease